MNDPLPQPYQKFLTTHPQIAQAYQTLGEAARAAGPLDAKEQALVKLGLAIGARLEGATHAHTRRALEAGCTPDEIRHAALLAVTTLGFPAMMTALTWVEDLLSQPAANAAADSA